MDHYTKIAVLLMRSMGLIILVYAVPIVLYGIARVAMGATTASDGRTSSASALFLWMIYCLAGALLLLLAEPLARIAARGLDATSTPPAP